MGYTSSYWEQDSFLRPYDLVVVGGGIVGLSTALFVKSNNPGKRVAVLERGFLPRGASTRNAGFACVGSIGEHLADLEKESEEEVRKRIKRRYEGLNLLKRTLGEDAIGYEHCGGYEFFRSRDDFEPVAGEIDRFNDWMEEMLGETSVYEAGELNGYPVISNRLEGALHPGRMMEALAARVSEAGVHIKWNSTVESVEPDGRVHLSDGPALEARKVLLAANGFVRRLLPELEVRPARGYVLLTNAQKEMPWKGIFHHDRGYVYFRNLGDSLLIGGARNLDMATEETDRFGTNETIREHLVDFVSGVLGLSPGWKVAHEWSGIMGFSPTKTPVIEQVGGSRYVAAGLSGMGIAIGMKVASEAARMLADG